MSLVKIVATESANFYINQHCQREEMQDKLLIWQRVYDTTLAALVYFEQELQEQRWEMLAQVSAN